MSDKVYWDGEDPLKPVEGESPSANAALREYAHMGYTRGLRPLVDRLRQMENPPTESWGTICEWSSKLDWQERIKRWDEIQRKHDEKVWRERRDSLRQREWDNFDRLQEIVSEMLAAMPNFITSKEKVIQEGKPKVILNNGDVIHEGEPEIKLITVQMRMADSIKLIRTASDIGRRAAEMNQDHMAKVLGELDFEKLEPEQISRLAAGEHVLDVLGVRK